MKRLLVLFTILTVSLVSIVPALATPVDELNDLARYFPADTPIFFSSRIDAAFFDALDEVVARVAEVAPPGAIPPMTISDALDQAIAEGLPEKTFSGDIRPWLGDTLAVGVLEIPEGATSSPQQALRRASSSDAPFVMAIAINDREAATTFITDAMTENEAEFTQTDEDGFTILEDPSDDDAIIVIRDDVILISNQPANIRSGGVPDGNLQANADFAAALANLPGDDYNITGYMDLGTIIQKAADADPEAVEEISSVMPLINALGPTSLGATILEGVSLTIDIAQAVDPAIYEEMGLGDMLSQMAPLDPEFAVHIPAGTPLAYHDTNLALRWESGMAGLNSQMAMLGAQGAEIDEVREQGLAMFTQFTGLDFEEDVISWMTGDYALFLMLNPDLDTTSQFGVFQTFPADFGIAIEATDPEQAAATVEGLTQGIEQLVTMRSSSDEEEEEVTVEITNETIVGASTTVITITAPDAPWPIELLLGANGEVFAFGTRNAVTSIFARDGGLPSSSTYTRAQDFLLPGSTSVAYLNPEGLLPLADLVMTFSNDNADTEEIAQTMREAFGLVASGTVSQSIDENGISRTRMVLTLSQE